MSGGHWDYSGARMRVALQDIAMDKDVQQRWPRIAALFDGLGSILYDAEQDMDWDLSADSVIPDDALFDNQVCHAILVLAMKAADDSLFPRGKWATIQAVQGRLENDAGHTSTVTE